MLQQEDNIRLVDLHGASVERSQHQVNTYLSEAEQAHTYQFRFVTGRGNHVNIRGERGTLFRAFPSWISEDNSEKIESIKKGDGYYEVHIKRPQEANPFELMFKKCSRTWVEENIPTIREGAEKNDPLDQCLLGQCYQFGIGLEKNEKQAAKWYNKAASQNHDLGQYLLASCYSLGQGVRQNDQKALSLFIASASQDFVWAIHQLGDMYCYGDGAPEDLQLARGYYKRASDLGLILATRKLGHIYFFGKGVKKDEKKGCRLYKKAADKGDAHAAYNIGCAYFYGRGVEKNPELAFQYTKQAADENDPDAHCLLSQCYQWGIGTLPDEERSFHHLRCAADNHFKEALFALAFHPRTEKAQKEDYLLRAAKAEHIVAQAMVLGSFAFSQPLSESDRKRISESFWKQNDEEVFLIANNTFKGIVLDAYEQIEPLTKKRRAKVLRLLHALAEQHCPQAFCRLGSLYHGGEMVRKDSIIAERYWLQGAQLGDASCLCALGYFYEEKGKLDPVAFEKAFYYHEQSTKKGSSNSYNQLALLYESGKGVKKDIGKAIEYFKEAMRLAFDREGLCYNYVFPHAAYNLAMLYLLGDENLVADRKKAIPLFKKSAEAGHEEAKIVLQRLAVLIRQEKEVAAQASVCEEAEEKCHYPFFKPVFSLLPSKLSEYKLPNDTQENLEKGLRMAAHNNRCSDLQKFIQCVKNIDAQDNHAEKRYTALHLAVLKGYKEIVQLLKQGGACAEIKDASNKTAIDYAMERGNKEIEDILLDVKVGSEYVPEC